MGNCLSSDSGGTAAATSSGSKPQQSTPPPTPARTNDAPSAVPAPPVVERAPEYNNPPSANNFNEGGMLLSAMYADAQAGQEIHFHPKSNRELPVDAEPAIYVNPAEEESPEILVDSVKVSPEEEQAPRLAETSESNSAEDNINLTVNVDVDVDVDVDQEHNSKTAMDVSNESACDLMVEDSPIAPMPRLVEDGNKEDKEDDAAAGGAISADDALLEDMICEMVMEETGMLDVDDIKVEPETPRAVVSASTDTDDDVSVEDFKEDKVSSAISKPTGTMVVSASTDPDDSSIEDIVIERQTQEDRSVEDIVVGSAKAEKESNMAGESTAPIVSASTDSVDGSVDDDRKMSAYPTSNSTVESPNRPPLSGHSMNRKQVVSALPRHSRRDRKEISWLRDTLSLASSVHSERRYSDDGSQLNDSQSFNSSQHNSSQQSMGLPNRGLVSPAVQKKPSITHLQTIMASSMGSQSGESSAEEDEKEPAQIMPNMEPGEEVTRKAPLMWITTSSSNNLKEDTSTPAGPKEDPEMWKEENQKPRAISPTNRPPMNDSIPFVGGPGGRGQSPSRSISGGRPESPFRGRPESPFRGRPESPFRGRQESPLRRRPESPFRGRPESQFRGRPEGPFRGRPESPSRSRGGSRSRSRSMAASRRSQARSVSRSGRDHSPYSRYGGDRHGRPGGYGERMPPGRDRPFDDGRCRSPSPQRYGDDRRRCPSPQRFGDGRRCSPSPQRFRDGRRRSPSPQRFGDGRRRSPSPQRFRDGRRDSPSPQRFRDGRRRSPSPQGFGDGRRRSPSPQRFGDVRHRSPSPQQFRDGRRRSPSPQRFGDRERSPERGGQYHPRDRFDPSDRSPEPYPPHPHGSPHPHDRMHPRHPHDRPTENYHPHPPQERYGARDRSPPRHWRGDDRSPHGRGRDEEEWRRGAPGQFYHDHPHDVRGDPRDMHMRGDPRDIRGDPRDMHMRGDPRDMHMRGDPRFDRRRVPSREGSYSYASGRSAASGNPDLEGRSTHSGRGQLVDDDPYYQDRPSHPHDEEQFHRERGRGPSPQRGPPREDAGFERDYPGPPHDGPRGRGHPPRDDPYNERNRGRPREGGNIHPHDSRFGPPPPAPPAPPTVTSPSRDTYKSTRILDQSMLEEKFKSSGIRSRGSSGGADDPVSVEISPGVRVPLRRSHETMKAISVDFYQSVICVSCAVDIFSIADVSYVICPRCRVISPMIGDTFEGREIKRYGLGLGFTYESLFKMQSEIIQDREKNGKREGEDKIISNNTYSYERRNRAPMSRP